MFRKLSALNGYVAGSLKLCKIISEIEEWRSKKSICAPNLIVPRHPYNNEMSGAFEFLSFKFRNLMRVLISEAILSYRCGYAAYRCHVFSQLQSIISSDDSWGIRVAPIPCFHHYVSGITPRQERCNTLAELQSLVNYIAKVVRGL